MKTLVISPQPFFTYRGTPFSVYYRTKALSELGVSIDFLTYGEGSDADIPNVNFIRIPRIPFAPPVKIGPSFLKLIYDFFMLIKLFVLVLRRRYDFIHAHEEGIFMILAIFPVLNSKIIYDMHSSLPQQLHNFRFSSSKILVSIFEKLEKSAIRKSDTVITICEDLYDYAVSIAGSPEKIENIENSIFDPVQLKQNISQPAGLPVIPRGKTIFLYTGNLEIYQGLDLLIESAAEVARQTNKIIIIVAGGRPEHVSRYRQLSEELNLQDIVVFLGQTDQLTIAALIEKSHVLLSPRLTGNNVPLKIYQYMASGKPIIATEILAHTQILNSANCILAKPDSAGFSNAILQALNDSRLARQVARKAKAEYNKKYTRKIYMKKLKSILENLTCAALPE